MLRNSSGSWQVYLPINHSWALCPSELLWQVSWQLWNPFAWSPLFAPLLALNPIFHLLHTWPLRIAREHFFYWLLYNNSVPPNELQYQNLLGEIPKQCSRNTDIPRPSSATLGRAGYGGLRCLTLNSCLTPDLCDIFPALWFPTTLMLKSWILPFICLCTFPWKTSHICPSVSDSQICLQLVTWLHIF